MHDQRKGSPDAEDQLIPELSDPEDFSERDRIERAVRELVKAGLLFRSECGVLPTRAALRAYELLDGVA